MSISAAEPAFPMRAPDPAPGASELARRLRQHKMIARFGCFALREDALQPVLDEACRIAAEGLEVRYAKVLEWQPAAGDFLVRAGVGWHPGVVGRARLGADIASPAGYAFQTGEPLISNHLAREGRFRTPAVLIEHGVRRALNVLVSDGATSNGAVPDGGGRFGVLEADSPEDGGFDRHDTDFLQSLANIVAASAGRRQREDALRERESLVRSVLAASPDCVCVLDAEGAVLSISGDDAARPGPGGSAAVPGRPWGDLWPASEAGRISGALDEARAGRTARFEAPCPTAAGAPRWWNAFVAPLPDGAGAAGGRILAISRDISARVAAAAAKDALLREKDLLMQEVHHRVKNSLQLVQSLLGMQGRASADAAVGRQLAESAARVRTIAAIHDRLYRAEVTPEQRVEVGPYLAGLIEDLREAMLADTGERAIHFEAEAQSWPVSEVPTLGLVLTELVTNALKYGRGVVRVLFRARGADGAPELVVEDEGPGLPAGFDPAAAAGFGMRLVIGLLEGGGGIAVDRAAGHTRFVARLRPVR